MKLSIVLLGYMSILLFFNGKKEPQGIVLDRPLVWKDFKGNAPKNVSYKASTATITGYKVAGTRSQPSFEVVFKFDPKKSWVSKQFLKTADEATSASLLKHEQGHYDISQVIAWELEAALNAFSFDKNKVQYQIDSIYRVLLTKQREIQAKYDEETSHSRVEEEQEKWNRFIEEALKNKTINL
ncbi:MAG: DUF922 domain-containing protein [Flavipsychrobacter sp.]